MARKKITSWQFFFFFLASLFRENSASEREEKTRRETRHTLIRQGSLPLLFHLPEFTSALILDFFVQPLTFSRAEDSIDLVGRITKSEIVSCNTGSITTCLTKGGSDLCCILGGWLRKELNISIYSAFLNVVAAVSGCLSIGPSVWSWLNVDISYLVNYNMTERHRTLGNRIVRQVGCSATVSWHSTGRMSLGGVHEVTWKTGWCMFVTRSANEDWQSTLYLQYWLN